MKKAETIIQQISKLEQELYTNYTSEKIKKAIERCEDKKLIPLNCDDLVSVIYEGVCMDISLNEFIEE